MSSTNRTLIAIAFAGAVASGPSFAQANAQGARAAAPAMPAAASMANAHASDAVTARAASRAIAPNGLATGDGTAKTTASATSPGKGNWWTDADSDADGKLSVAESAANTGLHARFAAIDADKDGFVTQDEYRTYFNANASQSEQDAAANSALLSRDLWLKLDADADSRISLAEAIGNAGLSASFTKMDGNSDGYVTQAEYTTYAKLHK